MGAYPVVGPAVEVLLHFLVAGDRGFFAVAGSCDAAMHEVARSQPEFSAKKPAEVAAPAGTANQKCAEHPVIRGHPVTDCESALHFDPGCPRNIQHLAR